jgi:hypothetical protein
MDETDAQPRNSVGNAESQRQLDRRSTDPLLDWIAGELQEADGMDEGTALRAARCILKQAFAATAHTS